MRITDIEPVTWHSIHTKRFIESSTKIWNGGANDYTVGQISVDAMDAANGLMAPVVLW